MIKQKSFLIFQNFHLILNLENNNETNKKNDINETNKILHELIPETKAEIIYPTLIEEVENSDEEINYLTREEVKIFYLHLFIYFKKGFRKISRIKI